MCTDLKEKVRLGVGALPTFNLCTSSLNTQPFTPPFPWNPAPHTDLNLQAESSGGSTEASDMPTKKRFEKAMQASFSHGLSNKSQRSMLLRYSSRRTGFDTGPAEYRWASRIPKTLITATPNVHAQQRSWNLTCTALHSCTPGTSSPVFKLLSGPEVPDILSQGCL
jgi:hypothetical protein